MAEQLQHTELVEQLERLDIVFHIQTRLGMYVYKSHDYDCVMSFFRGYDVALKCKVFDGFQKFIESKFEERCCQIFYALIPTLCFGDNAHLKMQQPENHQTAIEYFFSSLKVFRQGLQETEYLLRSPANAERILTALKRAKEENIPPTTFEALKAEMDRDSDK